MLQRQEGLEKENDEVRDSRADERLHHRRAGFRGRPSGTVVKPDDDLAAIEFAALHQGNMAYSAPGAMKTGQSQVVTAEIGSDTVSAEAMRANLPERPQHDDSDCYNAYYDQDEDDTQRR